ncbi:pyridoxine pyridoxamine 5 -phosphate oxidase 2 isoform X1 [Olea europaea subsp. europaea]|uniref:pyridoxal 5'-phosphate synthase n=1 Tax=Olea europaea subsp. europaea TaxID=158383 RepID=A0A8S0TY14_OLEEU|nr:pyridoxine pyridoxamine 5 -phosphate oxidase 2 isoform X1 [Olea europaea subsp. europaea]
MQLDDLKRCSFAEICWYFTDSWEQFRINGKVDVIDGSNPDPLKLQQREKAWFASSIKSRLQYLGPTPGIPSVDEQPSQVPTLDPSTSPVGVFCLLVLDPDQVDYLNLKSNERVTYTAGHSAEGEKIWTWEKALLEEEPFQREETYCLLILEKGQRVFYILYFFFPLI